jgi:hypothetical protein
MKRYLLLSCCIATIVIQALPAAAITGAAAPHLAVATFKADITPPMGTPLCDALCQPASAVDDPLWARGVVLLPAEQQPIVLLALDWVGVGNEGHDAFRQALAEAVGTTIDRVTVHSLHQHDTPGCDFAADRIAAEHGLGNKLFNVEFAHEAINRVASAAKASLESAQPATHVSVGIGTVEKVASNRRVLGPDGKVKWIRWSSCRDPEAIAQPEGTIDPQARAVGFWNNDHPLAILTYYATHPQSYYCKGRVSADFVGMARSIREQELPGPLHVHFNGAGGNVTAGKYNDGSPEMRPVLAQRLAAGLAAAWNASEKFPVENVPIEWATREVALPVAKHLDEDSLQAEVANDKAVTLDRLRAARDLAFLQRCQHGPKITLSRLRLGKVDLIHMPGELFVEYQLAAQKMRPGAVVCMAAYGDYGPGYIGLHESYSQGGYETGPVSRVAPNVEAVLTSGMAELLK